MVDNPVTLEEAAAGVLNGVMISLLGAAFPVFAAWRIIHDRGGWAFELDAGSLRDSVLAFGLLAMSIQLLRTGAPLTWRSVAALRRVSRSSPPG